MSLKDKTNSSSHGATQENDQNRDITREKQENENAKNVVPKGQEKTDKKTPVERNGSRHS